MKETFKGVEGWGYWLCMGSGPVANIVSRVWFRWYCPYPVIADHTARACVEAGLCGCDNRERIK